MSYIDTSVLAAYYCPEKLSSAAQKAILNTSEPVISPLVEVEFQSAVAAKVRMGEITREDAVKITGMLKKHIENGSYRIVQIESAEYALAENWIGEYSTPLRALDALHLAAALTNGLAIMTADKSLAKSAKHFKVQYKFIS